MIHVLRRPLDLAFIKNTENKFSKHGVSETTDTMNYLINFLLKDWAFSCLDYIVEVVDTNFQQAKE